MSTQIAVLNPRTGQTDHEINALKPDDLKVASDKVRAAQRKWAARTLQERGKILIGLADLLENNTDIIIKALEADTGRRRIAGEEVSGVIASLRGWAALAPTLLPEGGWVQGRMRPTMKHKNDFVPYALVGVISPWNFPMTLSFIDTIPALMAGACVMVKPSEVTPRFADALTPIIAEAGLANILQFVQGGGETGAALIDCVDCICFTGSVPTGRKVAMRAAENLIPANLELGGKDPLIIAPEADLEMATSVALRSSSLATGQACQSIERIYVHVDDYEPFTRLLAKKAKAITLTERDIGCGHLGPFIFSEQAKKVAAQIDDAVLKGAKVLSGGRIERHGGGYWLAPTVLTDVTHDMEVMVEETFGPVLPVMAYDTIEQAIDLANDTVFGLSAAVFAKDIEAAMKIGQHIHAGAISLQDGALTGLYYEAGKQSFGQSGLGPSRMGADGFLRFFRKRAFIANTVAPLTLDDFKEG